MGRRTAAVLLLTVLVMALVPAVPAGGVGIIPPLRHHVLDGLPAVATEHPGLSRQVATPIAFSLVGVSVPEGARVLLRTADLAGDWSPWTEAEALGDDGDGPDPGSAEGTAARPGWERMSEPLWVGEATRVQLRVLGGQPEDVAVHLVDALGTSRSLLERFADAWRGPWQTARASASPPVVTRAQWGADESLRGGAPEYSGSTRAGILHHTAGSNDYTPEQAAGVVRAIYAYHTRSLGWSDIGYNLLVDRFGTVYEGRAGGLDRGVIGAHAGGFNTETFGISVLGTFMSGLPPGPALDAAVAAIAWKFGVHGINADPNATVDITSRGSSRYPKGQWARLHTLSAHRDVSATACPGDALYAHMAELRRRVHAGVPPVAPPAPAPVPPSLMRRLLPSLPELGLPLAGPEPLTPPTRDDAAVPRRADLPVPDVPPLRAPGGEGLLGRL